MTVRHAPVRISNIGNLQLGELVIIDGLLGPVDRHDDWVAEIVAIMVGKNETQRDDHAMIWFMDVLSGDFMIKLEMSSKQMIYVVTDPLFAMGTMEVAA